LKAEKNLNPDITVGLLYNKVRNLQTSYKKAVSWSKETGQGVTENDGPQVFESNLLKTEFQVEFIVVCGFEFEFAIDTLVLFCILQNCFTKNAVGSRNVKKYGEKS
jgi:hypothetical protein